MLTKAMVEQMAVNDSAFSNGRKLAEKGSFTNLKKTQDGKFHWGLCKGSGKTPYATSVDTSDETKLPVCRCSCPSRQFPCKHGIALMLLMADGAEFTEDTLPEELAEKKAKAEERELKKAEKAEKPKKKTAASVKAAEKKAEKQLEGLLMARKMVDELMTAGLATLTGTSREKLTDLATELYNYGLPGPQLIFNRIAESMEILEDGDEEEKRDAYANAIRHLIKLNTIIKKGTAFLEKKMADSEFGGGDDALFEELGGIWKLDELERINSLKENARLIELSFETVDDKVKGESIEKSWCVDLDTKEICVVVNMVPKKARAKMKSSDSCFEMILVPKMYKYPGTSRVRWDSFTTRPITAEDRLALAGCAEESFSAAEKKFKNHIKNTLHEKELAMILPLSKIGKVGDGLFIDDGKGGRIQIEDAPEENGSSSDMCGTEQLEKSLRYFPVDLESANAVFGKMFYNRRTKTIQFQIHSFITKEAVVRLS
nr:SWIM zinc finger family protein [Treponema sp.]